VGEGEDGNGDSLIEMRRNLSIIDTGSYLYFLFTSALFCFLLGRLGSPIDWIKRRYFARPARDITLEFLVVQEAVDEDTEEFRGKMSEPRAQGSPLGACWMAGGRFVPRQRAAKATPGSLGVDEPGPDWKWPFARTR